MLAEMETGKTFSLEVVRYDRKRRTAPRNGERQTYHEAKLHRKEKVEDQAVAGRKLTEREQKIEEIRQLRYEANSRNPNHYRHYTRNIVLCADGFPTSEIRKIHPPLVLHFNNKKVVP